MNDKQCESAAKYGYDISKGAVLLALVGAIGESGAEQALQLLSGGAGAYFIAWRFEL